MNVLVRSAGLLTTVQDLGRTFFRQSGVSLGGALDSHALRIANALVGNEDSAAGLEVTLGNLRLHFADTRVIAWCGGAFTVRIGDEDLPRGHAVRVDANEELIIIAPNTGARAWLAISGGINVPRVLGSRSADLRGKFGGHEGRALRDGDNLPLGEPCASERIAETFGDQRISEWSAPATWVAIAARDAMLRILPGPNWELFKPDAQISLVREAFTVTADSDRMGVRLDGQSLDRVDAGDLLSEAVAPGALQVPPNGKPILLLGDCQTIGGYPKIAHVITVDLPIVAQVFPGDVVRFHEVSLAQAHELLRAREDAFARFRIGLGLRSS